MKISHLIQGIDKIEIRGKQSVEISGLSSDSRVVAPGDLFIAKKGIKRDGAVYIPQAVNAGAKAVVTDVYNPFIPILQIIHPFPHTIEAKLAARFYGEPAKQLRTIGVTGTKGKTTTTYLIRHMLEKMGEKCGLLGTIEMSIGDFCFPSDRTTKDPISNQKWLKEMVMQKCHTAILEVSSHGLEQGRVGEIPWDVGVFTNLYADHLDYHPTIEHYAAAKAKLFTQVRGTSVLNIDNSWAQKMKVQGNVLSFGIQEKADLQASGIHITEEGIRFSVGDVPFFVPIVGMFNVYNVLSAVGVGVARGYPLQALSESLADFPGVPGRLERVPNTKGIHIFVDYAHTGEALCEVLKTLRGFAKKKIIVVFGCGGERDPGRRPKMAEAAEQYADIAVITNDNPRSEDPEKICREILVGFTTLSRVVIELDRAAAIGRAIALAEPQDIVIIAGKGHEKIQIFSHQTVIFDDIEVAGKVCSS